jgi:hypothetical protein
MTTTERKVRLPKGSLLKEAVRHKAEPGVIVPLVKDTLLQDYTPDIERRWDIIHPSEMAKKDWCHRATWERIVSGKPPALEKFDFFRENIFGEGNIIHEKWQRWLKQSGKLWGDWHCPLCNDYYGETTYSTIKDSVCDAWNGTLHQGRMHTWEYREISLGVDNDACFSIMGHADGAVERTMVEFKSVGLGTIRIDAPELLEKYQINSRKHTDLTGLFKAIERPLQSHLRQGDIYLWLAQQDGLEFDSMSYVYEFKANQMVKEFPVKLNMRRVQPLLDKAEEVHKAIRSGGDGPECQIADCTQCTAKPRKIKRVIIAD